MLRNVPGISIFVTLYFRAFNNTGVRSDMRPGFFYLGQKRPKFAFSFQSG